MWTVRCGGQSGLGIEGASGFIAAGGRRFDFGVRRLREVEGPLDPLDEGLFRDGRDFRSGSKLPLPAPTDPRPESGVKQWVKTPPPSPHRSTSGVGRKAVEIGWEVRLS
jgi:hypothetical protein